MEVHFTPEQEEQLTQLAIKAGTDTERLVKETILRLLTEEPTVRGPVPELPVFHLGAMTSLRRCDIYDDVP